MDTTESCFFCHVELSRSRNSSFNIFKTIIFPIEKRACELIADLLDLELTEGEVHSDFICQNCFKLVNEFADLESRAAEIRTDLTESFTNTRRLIEEELAVQVKKEAEEEERETEEEDRVTEEEDNTEEVETQEEQLEELEESDENELEGQEQDESNAAFDAEKMTKLASHVGSATLSDLIFKAQEDGGRTKLLVVNDGGYEEIELADLIGAENLIDLVGNDEASEQEADGEKVIELVGSKHVCQLCPQDDNERPFSCETKNLSLMSVHLKQEHDIRLALCDVCGAAFKKRSELNSHMECHHGDGVHECEICQRVFDSLRLYRIHRKMHTSQSKAWGCETCGKKYSSKNLLEEHQNMHNGIRPYDCKMCGKSFASKYTFKAHQKTHESRERNYACNQCGKSFLSAQNLQQHVKTHSEMKEHVCNICGKGFGTARNLEVHGIVHTGVKPFKCRHCGKAFARKAEIKDHERTHTGERPFACDMCGAQFSQRSNLQSHRRVTHFDDRRYMCSECDKGFKRRRLLDYHVKAVHTGERPYQCVTCDATFVYPEHYKKHIRIHSGIKPYKCEVCEKAFNSRDNRNAHRFVHSDKKPYECLVCGLGFMRKPLLYNHMQQAGHVNDTIVVNQPRLEKDDGIFSASEQDGEIELTIVDDNDLRSKLYLSDLNEHVIIQGGDNTLLAKFPDGTIKREEMEKQLIDEGGNFVDLDGNIIEINDEMTMTAHINEHGQLVNEDGQIISQDGQALIVDETMNEDSSSCQENVLQDKKVKFVEIRMPEGHDQQTWLNVVKGEDPLN